MSTEFQDYAAQFKLFTDAMKHKLHKNRHKGRWENLSIERAFERMQEEIEELREAIASGNTMDIMLESSDVANFAFILSTIAIEQALGVSNVRTGIPGDVVRTTLDDGKAVKDSEPS